MTRTKKPKINIKSNPACPEAWEGFSPKTDLYVTIKAFAVTLTFLDTKYDVTTHFTSKVDLKRFLATLDLNQFSISTTGLVDIPTYKV